MLNQYEMLNTHSFEHARYRYRAEHLDLSPVHLADARRDGAFLARAFPSASGFLYYYRNTIDTMLTAPAENPDYWIAVPVSKITRASGEVRVRPVRRTGRIASPGVHDPIHLPGHSDNLGVSVSQQAMTRFAAQYLGQEVGPIRFDPRFDLDRGVHRMISQHVAMLAEEDLIDPTFLHDPRVMRDLEQSVLSLLFFHCPHDRSATLENPIPAPAPRDVRRVIDLIHAAPEAELTLDDLVAAAEVPGRTLNEHFRNFTGLSPMMYLRRERLRMARQLLRTGEAASVTEAATASGHYHLGRFSVTYAQTFGESPSETLAKRRVGSG